MRRGAIESLLGRNLRSRDGSANGGAGGTGFNVEGAPELSHAFAHAGDADAEMGDIGLGEAIEREFHTAAEVDDLEHDGGRSFEKADGGGAAAGMALDIGKAFLNDAEEGDFDELWHAAEKLGKDELSFDAAAFAEAMNVFLESGDEAEFIEQGRMKEIGEGAYFAGHLLEQGASFFEGALGGFAEGRGGMANLGETQIDGKNGLRKAIVELAANAAALLVLEIKELRGELMDGLLGVFHFGDIGKRRDDAEDGAVWIELRDGIAENPEDFRETGAEPTHGAAVERPFGAEDGRDRTVLEGHEAAVFVDRGQAQRGNIPCDDFPFGDANKGKCGLISEFDFAVGAVEDNGNVEVADESAETLLAFAESIESFALFGDVGKRGEDTSEIARGIELRNGVEEGPENFIGVRKTPGKDLAPNRLAGGNDRGGGTGGLG